MSGIFENVISNVIENRISKFFKPKNKKRNKLSIEEDRYYNAFRFFYEIAYENLYLKTNKLTSDEFDKLDNIINEIMDDRDIFTIEIRWTIFRNFLLQTNTNKDLIELLYKVEELLNINFPKNKFRGK